MYRLIAAMLLTASLCHADSYRFDMGRADTPVAPGHLQVTQDTTLDRSPDYGWLRRPEMIVNRNEPTNPYFAEPQSLEYLLYSDGTLSLGENTFTFKVKPGTYAVTAIIGDLALGEGRPGNSIWANGQPVVTDAGTNASVKAFLFPVDAPEGKIELRFRADSSQRYSTVQGVTAEPVAEGQTVTPAVTEYPTEPVTVDTYNRNWQRLVTELMADWEQAKAQLTAEGADPVAWAKTAATLRQQPGYREYWGWSLGGGSWERLAQQTGGLDLQRLCEGFKEMGLDGFMTNSPAVLAGLRQAGLKHAVSASAEGFPRPDMTGITLNLLKNEDGSTQTIDRVWSNVAPEVISVFQDTWRERFSLEVTDGASFFLIDEPRGMWGSGSFGDYSEAAQTVFKRWAAEKGYADLAQSGIPERRRSLAFYRFYQFRLQSVAYLTKAFIKDTPVENLITAPGNGDVGPEQMNHNSYWPPAMAAQGLISTCWAYHEPASCKMYAETIAMAREFGGQSMIVPPLYPEEHAPLEALPMHTACLSAMTTRVNPWHFGGPLNGPQRPEWMKDVYYSARLTHATSGLQRAPSLYVWCPESIVYNDLVDFNRKEAEHWAQTYKALYDADLDYGVTNAFKVPQDAVVLYSCARPVLSAEEFTALRQFVEKGGTLLYIFTGTPELPDGKAITEWEKLPRERLVQVELTPEALRKAGGARFSPPLSSNPALKGYQYRRDGKRVHLLNNTDLEQPAQVKAPVAMRDVLTGKALAKGETVIIRPGLYALLAER